MTAPLEDVASDRVELRTWGGRWVAVGQKAFATRGQGAVWKVRDLREDGAVRHSDEGVAYMSEELAAARD